ncbi:MAG: transcription elongation factor GreA [Lachnospiraceae bacterium]|jgi:transcription elongation factor GreA|nr:transcription elongation factor GreA [Lachnospiraceae bacterium]
MEAKKNIMTYEGMKKLEDELYDLKINKLKENSQKIKEAREQGDLSENAEYDAAKDEQRDIAIRIAEIEEILKNAEVVMEDDVDKSSIGLGCTVKILDIEENEEMTYRMVGSAEADSLNGTLSIESPLGAAMMKKTSGDTIEVEAPIGVIKYEILDFRRDN